MRVNVRNAGMIRTYKNLTLVWHPLRQNPFPSNEENDPNVRPESPLFQYRSNDWYRIPPLAMGASSKNDTSWPLPKARTRMDQLAKKRPPSAEEVLPLRVVEEAPQTIDTEQFLWKRWCTRNRLASCAERGTRMQLKRLEFWPGFAVRK